MFEPISTVDPLSLGLVCLMLIFDTILYMTLTVYLESVLPSEYGVRKPWYYVFQVSSFSQLLALGLYIQFRTGYLKFKGCIYKYVNLLCLCNRV